MAKTTRYTATDRTGFVHTRTTARTYTHTVVARRDFDEALKTASTLYKVDGDNWDYYGRMVAWGGLYRGERMPYHTDEYVASELAKYTALRAEYASREEAMAGASAKRVAAVMAKKAAGGYDVFENLGWCGRADLAANLANKSRGGIWTEVTILEAVAA